jgi:hypothetical protein
MDVQTSVDGINWASGNRNVNPGTTVQFRYRVTFNASGTTAIPTGFSSLTFQPTISNYAAGDTLASFATVGNNTNGGTVTDTANGAYGRISPFGSTGPTTTDPYAGQRQASASVNYLRVARSTITNWVGDGLTTGTSAANNFNGAGGLACVQKSFSLVGSADPAFNASISNVVLVKLAFTLSTDTASRVLTIDAPTLGMSRNTTSGAREAAWFSSNTDNFGSIKAAVQVAAATVTIVPAPGMLGLVGMGGVVALRRRSR